MRDNVHFIYSHSLEFSAKRIFDLGKSYCDLFGFATNVAATDVASPNAATDVALDETAIMEMALGGLESSVIDETDPMPNTVDLDNVMSSRSNSAAVTLQLKTKYTINPSLCMMEKMLQCLPNVGFSTAEALINADITLETIADKKHSVLALAAIPFLKNHGKIGLHRAKNIFGSHADFDQLQNYHMIKILTCLDGVSDAVAKIILSIFTMRQLIVAAKAKNMTIKQQIDNLKYGARRISSKISTQLFDALQGVPPCDPLQGGLRPPATPHHEC
jgi:hypothetical protein